MRHRNVRAALTLATAAALALTPPPVVVLPRGAALAPTRDDEISVLAWNVLAERYRQRQYAAGAPAAAARRAPRAALVADPAARAAALARACVGANADVLCLQETKTKKQI